MSLLPIYDFHTHLNSDQLYPDRNTYLQQFVDIGGRWLVNIWVSHQRNLRAIHITKHHSTSCIVKATAWIHPGYVWPKHSIHNPKDIEDEIIKLKKLYNEHSDHIVAIWEIWIDAHRDRDDEIQALQICLFERQCQLASRLQLPVVIHSRDNFDLTLQVLKKYSDLKIYFHCRWYTAEDVQQAYDVLAHLWIGFCGNLTYPKATPLRESFQKCLDLEIKIVLETDAPYLAPQAIRWDQNTPAAIKHLYDRVWEKYGNNTLEKQEKYFKSLYSI